MQLMFAGANAFDIETRLIYLFKKLIALSQKNRKVYIVIITIIYSEYLMNKDFDIESCKIEASKHFMLKYMKKWNWDFVDLREAIKNAYKVDKVGKKKYEAYSRKNGSKKIIFIFYLEYNMIFVITGSEGD